MAQIEALGYRLNEQAKEVLSEAFGDFFLGNIGPAPFSMHAVTASEVHDGNITVTNSEHQLQIATHFVRSPKTLLLPHLHYLPRHPLLGLKSDETCTPSSKHTYASCALPCPNMAYLRPCLPSFHSIVCFLSLSRFASPEPLTIGGTRQMSSPWTNMKSWV